MKTMVCSLLLLLPFLTNAQPGTLDKSFGDTGVVLDKNVMGIINVIALQSDGKIVASGGMTLNNVDPLLITRYNTNGSLDKSFGKNGFTGADELSEVFGMAIQKDDAIVALGHTSSDIKLAKYKKDGGLDSSFGGNGTVITSVGNADEPADIAIQPDGKIVVGGYIINAENEGRQAFLIRYLPDGSLDKSFAEGGVLVFSVISDPRGLATLDAIALQKDGKIVAATTADRPYVYRFNPDGSLDKGFGNNGEAYFRSIAGKVSGFGAKQIAIQEDGKIVGGGYSITRMAQQSFMAAARLTADGSIDSSFGQKGLQYVLFGENNSQGNAVLLQGDGKIVITGYEYDYYSTYERLALARFNGDGTVDSSFGDNGGTITAVENFAVSEGAALQKDGKVVLGGSTGPYSLLARYNNNDGTKQPLAIRIKRWLQHHGISWGANSNIRYYTVQRSSDGIVYKEVAKLGNSSNSYEDAAPLGKESYYRLMAIAKDGSRAYSNTVLIDESQQVRMFPNPVKDNLQLQGLATNGKTAVSVVDLQGNVRTTAMAGGGSYSVNTANLTPGNYLLKLQHNGTTTTLPFVRE